MSFEAVSSTSCNSSSSCTGFQAGISQNVYILLRKDLLHFFVCAGQTSAALLRAPDAVMPKFPVHWIPVTRTSSDMSNTLSNSFLVHKLKETTASPSSTSYFGPNITFLKNIQKTVVILASFLRLIAPVSCRLWEISK